MRFRTSIDVKKSNSVNDVTETSGLTSTSEILIN